MYAYRSKILLISNFHMEIFKVLSTPNIKFSKQNLHCEILVWTLKSDFFLLFSRAVLQEKRNFCRMYEKVRHSVRVSYWRCIKKRVRITRLPNSRVKNTHRLHYWSAMSLDGQFSDRYILFIFWLANYLSIGGIDVVYSLTEIFFFLQCQIYN